MKNVDYYNIYVNGTLNTTSTQNSTYIIFNINAIYNITLTAVNEFGESQPSDPIFIIIDVVPVYGWILLSVGVLTLLGGIAVIILMKKKQ
ncbi:MAG: fibronectin type III domain-containing protein [Promethearchaeota archaeon]